MKTLLVRVTDGGGSYFIGTIKLKISLTVYWLASPPASRHHCAVILMFHLQTVSTLPVASKRFLESSSSNKQQAKMDSNRHEEDGFALGDRNNAGIFQEPVEDGASSHSDNDGKGRRRIFRMIKNESLDRNLKRPHITGQDA